MKVSSFNEIPVHQHSGYLRCPPYPQTPDDHGLSPAGPVLDHPSLPVTLYSLQGYSITHTWALLDIYFQTISVNSQLVAQLSINFNFFCSDE